MHSQLDELLRDILDVESRDISPETYLIRDLNAESIDLMELAVTMSSRFRISVEEDQVFLRSLRKYLSEAETQHLDKQSFLKEKYPFLSQERIREILSDLQGGPVLKIKDLDMYIDYYIPK